jgi:endogenous inhibitor of DNA gyrase (YacG/DUF329 family)
MDNIFEFYLTKSGRLDSNKIKKFANSDQNLINLQNNLNWCESISELYYCYQNNINTRPLCGHCDQDVKYYNPKSGYAKFCSKVCTSRSDLTILTKLEKRKSKQVTDLSAYKLEFPWITTTSEGKYCKQHHIVTQPECFCGNKIKFIIGHNYPKRCSYSCANKQDALSKLEKTKLTNLKKYGVDNYAKSDEWKNRYGEIQEKIIETSTSKYGTRSFNQRKCKDIDLTYNKEYLHQKHIIENIPVYAIAEMHSTSSFYLGQRMKKMGITINALSKTSYKEELIANFIKNDLGVEVERNCYGILDNKRELDLKYGNFAIELDSLYWHSYDKKETWSQINKHQQKSLDCHKIGIDLYHIWDYEWKNKRTREIWKSMIRYKLAVNSIKRVFARKCLVKEIDKNLAKEFCKENHIQASTGCAKAYGLFYENQLLSVMTFGIPRFNKKYQWELLRFCTLKNHIVIGGASKLLTHFERENKPKSLISYANIRWSNGNLYKTLMFTYKGISKPSYSYTDKTGTKILSRNKCQKHKLSHILDNFDVNKTEYQNMFEHGYRRFWDCGNFVFIKHY